MQVENGQVVLNLIRVRLSYAYIDQPYIGKNQAGKETRTYCLHALMDGAHASLPDVKQAQRLVAAAAWGASANDVLTQLAATDKLCLHNGSVTKAGAEDYAGKFYVSANGSKRPTVVVTRGGVNVKIEKDDPCFPYSGCWANVQVAIYPQSPNGKPSQWGKRINAQLMGVQFLEHDQAFGGAGKVSAPEEFPTMEAGSADAPAPAASDSSAAHGLL